MVKLPNIYYYRLFTMRADTIEEGTDFIIGKETFQDTLDLVLQSIKEHNGKYTCFEMYKTNLKYNDLIKAN